MGKKKKSSTKRINAIEDMVQALQIVLQNYSIASRKEAWKDLTSEKGQKEMKKLLRNPKRPTSVFRRLWTEGFSHWLYLEEIQYQKERILNLLKIQQIE